MGISVRKDEGEKAGEEFIIASLGKGHFIFRRSFRPGTCPNQDLQDSRMGRIDGAS